MRIVHIHARQILDSRGNPTVETEVELDSGAIGRAAVPSGASTGSHEALELRDGGSAYGGKGVLRAVDNVNTDIATAITGQSLDQQELDSMLIKLDGMTDKSRLGANAILSVSLAAAKASANQAHLHLFEYFGQLAGNRNFKLPTPMVNILNGGVHASGSTDFQEFMIMPVGFSSFAVKIRTASEIFHKLGEVLESKGHSRLVGDEGGYGPSLNSNLAALDLIIEAIELAGYKPGQQVALAIDVAASELYSEGNYKLKSESKTLDRNELLKLYEQIITKYPVVSIEDGLSENDWQGWSQMVGQLGDRVQLVGDDLLATNPLLIKKAMQEKAANALLVKPNQIGTLSQTIEAALMAQKAGWNAIISHRSGETEDTTIAHLAVGLGTGFIKTGSVSRGERTAKYNELLRIEEYLSQLKSV